MEKDYLDAVDLRILREVQENCRLTVKELAARVNLSATPVHERLKRLERAGYIEGYGARLNAEKLDKGFVVFCFVKLQSMNAVYAKAFTDRVTAIPDVAECYNVSGHYDYLLKIYASSMQRYQEFILNSLGQIDNISSIESTFVMAHVKTGHGIPL